MSMHVSALDVDGNQVTLYESGHRDPTAVLCLHGNSLSGASFAPQLESPLGERYRFVAIDYPGHGSSPTPGDPGELYTMAGMAAFYQRVAAVLGLERVVLLGHSLGGHLTLEIGNDMPVCLGMFIFGTPPVATAEDLARGFLPDGPALPLLFKGELTDDEVVQLGRTWCLRGESDTPPPDVCS